MLKEKAQVDDPRGRKYGCTDQGRTASYERGSGVMPVEQRGQVTHVKRESTAHRRNSGLGGSPAGLPWGGTSRMRREFHVRICEGLGVKSPGPTRRTAISGIPTAIASQRNAWPDKRSKSDHYLVPDTPAVSCGGQVKSLPRIVFVGAVLNRDYKNHSTLVTLFRKPSRGHSTITV